MKKLLIVLCCIILNGGCFLMIFTVFGEMKYSDAQLLSCTASTSGGMRGGSRKVSLSKEKDGAVVLKVSEREAHNYREITTVYQADAAALDNLRDLASKYSLYTASKCPYSKVRVLDGDTTSIYFDFGSDDYRVSEEQVMTKRMREGFRAVLDTLSSLAVGEGVRTIEQQKGMLHLKSGFTLQFAVEDAFDGRIEPILEQEHETAGYKDCGILLCEGETLDCAGAKSVTSAGAGSIVYSPKGARIILLYADSDFSSPVYVLARLIGSGSTAYPLIAEMEGPYSFRFNQ